MYSRIIKVLQNLNTAVLILTLMQLIWIGMWVAHLQGII